MAREVNGDGALVIERSRLQDVLDSLREHRYEVFGPTFQDGAVVYGILKGIDDLPTGWTDEQDGGRYRLKRRADNAFFGYAVGPHSWKQFLFPPSLRLWRASKHGNGFAIAEDRPAPPRRAFVGVRSCELHAMAVQDQVFLGGPHTDEHYRAARESTFVIVVNCGCPSGTCFCASMGTGPRATEGFDLALTEVLDGGDGYFLVEPGTAQGSAIMAEVPHRPATKEEVAEAARVIQQTVAHMGRSMDTAGIKDMLYRAYDHPRWDAVAGRCLTCGNCTMVCPTCFCATVEDSTDLAGDQAERWRRWDSCFTLDFSYIHGGNVRTSPRSRYRQWMTHKLATWIDQFGTSGCVGCGRCITWCPAGIDITEEVRAIRETEVSRQEESDGEPNP